MVTAGCSTTLSGKTTCYDGDEKEKERGTERFDEVSMLCGSGFDVVGHRLLSLRHLFSG